MIAFNEGTPGAGKSYDAVETHILPAIKAGRQVYARLNGLNHEKIAAYLEMPVELVNARLHDLSPEDVLNIHNVAANDSLIVIDEAHEYYVSSREKMDPKLEDFFAKHRHKGFDILLISQWYKRLHSAVRARIERKAVFTKLSAVGSDSRFLVRHYQTIEPDKFEKTDAETRKYNKDIFPLYSSVEAGTQNTQVYKAGGSNVFKRIGKYGLVMVPLALFAIYYVVGFFRGDHNMVKQQNTTLTTPQQQGATGQKVTAGNASSEHAKKYNTDKMPPEVAYVFELANQARPRLAAVATFEDDKRTLGIVEFVESQSHIVERLTLAQISDLGVQVIRRDYGVHLAYKDNVIIVTSWPLDVPGRISEAQNQAIDSRPPFNNERMMIGLQPSVASLQTDHPGQGQGSSDASASSHRHPLGAGYDTSAFAPHSTQY
ncbi:MAG: zonular occludens toxin domain-containing protein [Rudaea sp.]